MHALHHHDSGHGHAHGHGHSHVHVAEGPHARARLLATVAVTGLIMLAEAIGGYVSGSLALLADAGHMLTDFLALLLAFAAMSLAQRPADPRRTYGYRRLEILAALLNGIALVVVSGSIAVEAVERWMTPREVDVGVMASVAGIGLIANLVGLWLLGGARINLNIRAAFLHILADTLSSAGVVIAAGVIALTGFTRLDAILSLVIAVVIVISSISLLREVVDVLLESAPRGIDTDKVRAAIGSVDGVAEVHDLHVWSIASGMPALSAHVVHHPGADAHLVLTSIQAELKRTFAIDHSTLQLERGELNCQGCD